MIISNTKQAKINSGAKGIYRINMPKMIASFILLFILLFHPNSVLSETSTIFESNMKAWEMNREMATKYLLEAEKSLKEGDELSGCNNQKKASEYGVKATKALINAMRINNSNEDIDNLVAGLNKWKEIGDFCS